MPRYIALLRAINVGGHTVKMDRLRALFGEMGFGDVETFIASGNVIFTTEETDARALEARIASHLQKALGYAVGTFLRTPEEMAAAAAFRPFGSEQDAEGASLYVGFLAEAPGKDAVARAAALGTEVDAVRVHGRELYWLCRVRSSDSKLTGPMFEKALGGMQSTLRNVTTVRKLAAKYPPA